MKKTGAWLARYALEQLPISFTFGIPGVHNTELYDELNQSARIQPILVTHEGSGAFAADAVSRTGGGRIGCLVIVPAAGLTRAMSGIGECYLDGIPLLVITGGTRTDVPFGFQLHELDQCKLAEGVTKGAWRVLEHRDIVSTLFEAYRTAVSGTPGPVLVEIPVNLQLLQGPVEALPRFEPSPPEPMPSARDLEAAVGLLAAASHPGVFVGWGAVDVADSVAAIAEMLGAPVSTTLQGLSAFPASHPLHAGMGFSRAAAPAAEQAFEDCDCLLAIGTAFGEIPTGSYGCSVPVDLIHIDISRQAIGRNYPAKVAIVGDARAVAPALRERLEGRKLDCAARRGEMEMRIAVAKQAYREEWRAFQTEAVNPALFFEQLRNALDDRDIVTVDDGNHTFLAAELFEVREPRTFISPTDFNCMGYAIPAAIGAKLANPKRRVASIVGDGAFLMTGLEIVTAATLRLGIVYFVFADGELSQISQGQQIPYNRKPCTVLGDFQLKGVAGATGARFIAIGKNADIAPAIAESFRTAATGQPVIVEVDVDYTKRTRFTQGVVKTVLRRFPLADRARFVARALLRRVTG
ncbi:MAG: thiamine pyrophosphate-binding protein [Acidobacteria bacterium]|nr:thiamine pyrophosphate-binding protein [Acidobacteriota bacterium]